MERINYKSGTWLCGLLKNCPCGRRFYSPLFGREVTYTNRTDNHIEIEVDGEEYFLEGDGAYNAGGECMLLPAKGCHISDWGEFCYYIMKEGDYVVGAIKSLDGIAEETIFRIEREYGELLGRGSDGYGYNIVNAEGKRQLNIFRFAGREEIEKYESEASAQPEGGIFQESRDGGSKKWILEYLYDGLRKSDVQFKDQFKHAIAWLERQGERMYIRFGEIPADEKSKIYRGDTEIGTENGVSVYPAFETDDGDTVLGLNLPITKTTLHTQQHLLEYDDRPCYLVKGNYVGKDADGQPLINNVSIIRRVDGCRVKEEPKFKAGGFI